MPRARSSKPPKTSQRERDGADVLEFLEKFPTKEFTQSQIARGSGVPDNYRIGPAVCLARAAAELRGARIETYSRSKEPTRNGALTLRYLPAGKGDADVAQDANPAGYAHVGNAFGVCLSTVSSIQELTKELWDKNNKLLEAAARIAEYEANGGKPPGLSIVSDRP